MKKLNTYDFYQLGVSLFPLTIFEPKADTTLGDVLFLATRARRALLEHIGDAGLFLPSSKRAASALIEAIKQIGVPDDLMDFPRLDLKKKLYPWEAGRLVQLAKDLETVLANDLPGLATYFVSSKGIYSTDDLISHAEMHLPKKIRSDVPQQANLDINEAGKCLAFELPTASAFHMWRAVETVMGTYYEGLTGQTFEVAGVMRNWAEYIKALDKAGADKKITAFLDHIRGEYRNPVTHPNVNLEPEEAFSLFGAAFSVIGQTVRAIQSLGKDS